MFLWTLLLLFSNIYADETALEKYCFSSPGKMQYMYDKAKILFLPTDKINKDGTCLTVEVSDSRIELVQKYLKNQDPQMQIAFSSRDVQVEPCKLKIEKIKLIKSENQNIHIQSGVVAETQNLNKTSSETFQIQTINNFEITVNENVIKGRCRFIRSDRYDITLEIKKDPRLTQPQVAPGTIITSANDDPMKIQEASTLSTQLQLTKGNRIELGSMVKDLSGASKKVDISPEFQDNQNAEQSTEQAFLSIE